MKNNKHLKRIIKKLVSLSFKDGKILESQVTKSIKILKSQPAGQAIEALTQYLKELKAIERQHILYLETVISLSPVQINKIKKIIEKKTRITKIVTKINPQILGGFKLRLGDEVWDKTIVGKIKQVKEEITGESTN